MPIIASVSANLSEWAPTPSPSSLGFLLFASLFHPMHCGFDGKISTNLTARYRPIGLEQIRTGGNALVESQIAVHSATVPLFRGMWRRVQNSVTPDWLHLIGVYLQSELVVMTTFENEHSQNKIYVRFRFILKRYLLTKRIFRRV